MFTTMAAADLLLSDLRGLHSRCVGIQDHARHRDTVKLSTVIQ